MKIALQLCLVATGGENTKDRSAVIVVFHQQLIIKGGPSEEEGG